MKWSMILHGIAAISGVVGFAVLIMWWVTLAKAGVSPFAPEHLYDDAIAFLLLSIAFGIGTLIHRQSEGYQLYKKGNPLESES